MNPEPQRESAVVMAVLMPHAPVLVPVVGADRAPEVAATVRALREAARRVVAARPDALVVVSPHSPRRPGAFGVWSGPFLCGSLAPFGAPEASVSLPVDAELAATIITEAHRHREATWLIPAHPLDHGAVVPLWFVAEAGWRGPTVVLGLHPPGEGGWRELGEAIGDAAGRRGRRIAVLASGDMSHRLTSDAPAGFEPRARDFDREFIERLERGDYGGLAALDSGLQELAGEDVLDSTLVALAAARWETTGHEVLSYEGPFGVGYGVAVLCAREPLA